MATPRTLVPLIAVGVATAACREDAPAEAPWSATVMGERLVTADGRRVFDDQRRPRIALPSGLAAASVFTLEGGRRHPLPFEAEIRGDRLLIRVVAPRPAGATGALCVTIDGAGRCWPARWIEPPDARPPAAPTVADLPPGSGITRLWALHALARAQRRRGAITEAIETWHAAEAHAETLGSPRARSQALRAAALLHANQGRLAEADALLVRAEDLLDGLDAPVDALRLAYYRAGFDAMRGRYRSATDALERAAAGAWDLGDDATFGFALDLLAVTLVDQGRTADALETIADPRLARLAESRDAIGRAVFLSNRGWIQLLAIASGAVPPARLADAERDLHAAEALVEGGPVLENTRANLAWAALLRDDLDAAWAAIQEVEVGARNVAAELIRGEVALRRGALEPAEAAFERAAAASARSAAGLPTDNTWRASYGLGRIAAARGDRGAALRRFREALAALDAVGTRTGVWHARARFYADRRPLVDDTVRLLLDGGDVAGAFAVIDAANARALRALEARTRLDRLPPARRAEWEAHRSRFAAARQARDAARDEGELLDGAEKAAWQAAQAGRQRAMVAAFEAAEALLTRAAPPRTATADATAIAAALPAGRALVAFGRVGGAVHGFWLAHGAPVAHAVVPGDAPEPAALLAPFADRLSGLEHLYVVPGDVPAARRLGLAAHDGAPLSTRISLSDLAYAGLARRPRSPVTRPPLVVADPTIDLPHAFAEGEAVAATLPDARLLTRGAATRGAVEAAMGGARAMHYAGHGVARADSPWQAHLALAGETTLTVADILTAEVPAGTVVLSGCRTGVRGALSDREALGLADAFVAAGSRAVLATRRNIPDEGAARFIARFHAAGGLDRPGAALAATTAEFHRRGDPVWSAFRLTGHP